MPAIAPSLTESPAESARMSPAVGLSTAADKLGKTCNYSNQQPEFYPYRPKDYQQPANAGTELPNFKQLDGERAGSVEIRSRQVVTSDVVATLQKNGIHVADLDNAPVVAEIMEKVDAEAAKEGKLECASSFWPKDWSGRTEEHHRNWAHRTWTKAHETVGIQMCWCNGCIGDRRDTEIGKKRAIVGSRSGSPTQPSLPGSTPKYNLLVAPRATAEASGNSTNGGKKCRQRGCNTDSYEQSLRSREKSHRTTRYMRGTRTIVLASKHKASIWTAVDAWITANRGAFELGQSKRSR